MRATRLPAILLKALRADANGVAQTPLIVQACSGQTADLMQIQDASGNVISAITSTGAPSNNPTTASLGTIQYADVTITNAQIKALRASPKTLVAAPGAGRMLEFVSIQLLNLGGTNALTETADNLAVKLTDGSGAQVSQDIETTGFLDQTAATVTNALPKIDAIVAVASAANKPLVLHNTGDGEYGGNAAADVIFKARINYRVHATA